MTKEAIIKIEELLETVMTSKSLKKVKDRPMSTSQVTGVTAQTTPKKDYADPRKKAKYTKSRY